MFRRTTTSMKGFARVCGRWLRVSDCRLRRAESNFSNEEDNKNDVDIPRSRDLAGGLGDNVHEVVRRVHKDRAFDSVVRLLLAELRDADVGTQANRRQRRLRGLVGSGNSGDRDYRS